MKIGIVGAGGHGRVVLDLILENTGMEAAGFFDQRTGGEGPYGWPILGDESSLVENWPAFQLDGVIVAIGDNRARRRIFEKLLPRGSPLFLSFTTGRRSAGLPGLAQEQSSVPAPWSDRVL